MSSEEHKFCGDLPAECPYASAKPMSLTVYRMVGSNPPSPEDFVPQGPEMLGISPDDPARYCESFGLSVIADPEGFQATRRLVKSTRKKLLIACGTITPDSGVVAHTPSKARHNHHTWWIYEGVSPHTLFKVV
jgi:hypothetical protein